MTLPLVRLVLVALALELPVGGVGPPARDVVERTPVERLPMVAFVVDARGVRVAGIRIHCSSRLVVADG